MANIYMLKCGDCGRERETDIPLEKMKPEEEHPEDFDLARADLVRCGVCAAFNWVVLRNVGKRIKEDKTAPEVLIKAHVKEEE